MAINEKQLGVSMSACDSAIARESVITCPECGISKVESMPTDACQFFYDCTGCGALLRPKAGDCCVFCSYGSVPCPPVQEQSCCAPGANL